MADKDVSGPSSALGIVVFILLFAIGGGSFFFIKTFTNLIDASQPMHLVPN